MDASKTKFSHTSVPSVLVVIPTYNERDSIHSVIERLWGALPEVHVLIVDDNSPDGTGEIANRLAQEDRRLNVLHRPRKSGLGTAYIEGFLWGLARNFEVLVEMDADGSHRPEELPALIQGLTAADLVLGSRWIDGGQVVNWSSMRQALSRAANWYARLVLAVDVRDVTAGFRAYRRNTLEGLPLTTISSEGYAFQIDLTLRVHEQGLVITEVPITFVERETGSSKMSLAIIAEAFWNVAVWGVRRATRRVGPVMR
jgi:dolichol-phosphate mannosyltransferase